MKPERLSNISITIEQQKTIASGDRFLIRGGGSAHLGAFVNTGNDHARKNAA